MAPVRAIVARLDRRIAEARAAHLQAPRPETDVERVKALLAHFVEVDQLALRTATELMEEGSRLSKAQEDGLHEELAKALHAVCDAHSRELEALLARHGWISRKVFGHDADSHAWLLVQHSDHRPDFQKAVLEKLDAARAKGETLPANYAYLWDRVAVNEGRPQRYGTQGTARSGTWTPAPLEDPAGVDARRKEVGLEPLAAYAARFRR